MSDFRLKVFQSVAKNLSFTKASQELFVSQPAITKHIQELETYYQARLFDRQGNKISLTKAGELLLKHSEKILDDYKQLEYEMHLLHNEYIGELKLGASTTIAQYVLPPLLANFIAKFPQINLSLINGNSRGAQHYEGLDGILPQSDDNEVYPKSGRFAEYSFGFAGEGLRYIRCV